MSSLNTTLDAAQQRLAPTCRAQVGHYLDRRTCGNPSKVVREGKHYCGRCDPVARAARYDRAAAKREAEQEERALRYAQHQHESRCKYVLNVDASTPRGEVAVLMVRRAVETFAEQGLDAPVTEAQLHALLHLMGDPTIERAVRAAQEAVEACD